VYIVVRLNCHTTNIYSLLMFTIRPLFLLHVSVTEDHHQAVNIGICLVIELLIWIHNSATCHII
jgi:hypothetical protein